jgi:hypothetical protein
MLDVLWPRQADNSYRGSRIALWLLGVVLLIKLAQSVVLLVDPAGVAVGADGIPLATYPAGAAGTIVALLVLMSMDRILLALAGVVVMVRYRSLLPLLLSALILHDASKRVMLHELMPVPRAGTPIGPYVNLAMLGLLALALMLSLPRRADATHLAARRSTA